MKTTSSYRLLLLLLSTLLPACSGMLGSQPVVEETIPRGGKAVQVLFTQPKGKGDKTQTGGIDATVVAAIAKAQMSVDLATFEFDLQPVAQVLVDAKKRGIQVRVVMDADNTDTDAYQTLKKAKVSIVTDNRSAFTHSKFIVLDHQTVFAGSWNMTENDTYRNNNNLLQIQSPRLAENYTREFEQMFVDKKFGPAKSPGTPNPQVQLGGILVENYFSPEDGISQHIVDTLRQAQKSVRFLAFTFTSDPIADALLDRAHNGVKVQGVFESRNASGNGSELPRLRQAGVEVREDGNLYTMHDKVMIVDDRLVITGSYNFTSQAENANDENILILHSPEVAKQYIAEWQKIWDAAGSP